MASHYIYDLRMRHSQVVDYILQYLKVTLWKETLFKRGRSTLMKNYTDVDYVNLVSDRRSILGYCTLLCGNRLV